MAIEEAFKAAVNIIRSMPKNGPFQPSPDLMLRFYGLFKQATEGICNQPKPAFWAVINKAKWDAWKNLGNMPKEEAMKNYVDELKQIVETMSFTEDVASFMHVLGPFYEIVYDGQEPDSLRQNSSPDPSELEKDHQEDESGYSSSINGTGAEENAGDLESGDLEAEKASSISALSSTSRTETTERFYSDAESDDEEFKDPLPEQTLTQSESPQNPQVMKNGEDLCGEQMHVTMALQRLQADLNVMNKRLESLETQRNKESPGQSSSVEQIGSFATVYSSLPWTVPNSIPSWFPFKNMNWTTIAIILTWPVVAQYIAARLRRRQAL